MYLLYINPTRNYNRVFSFVVKTSRVNMLDEDVGASIRRDSVEQKSLGIWR